MTERPNRVMLCLCEPLVPAGWPGVSTSLSTQQVAVGTGLVALEPHAWEAGLAEASRDLRLGPLKAVKVERAAERKGLCAGGGVTLFMEDSYVRLQGAGSY